MRLNGLILAAGRSSRMGQDKALLEYRGRSFLDHLIYLALPRVDNVIVVLGHNASKLKLTLPPVERVQAVINADYGLGMLSSLQTGLSRAGQEADWILWMLVDHPAMRGETLDQLVQAAKTERTPIVIPRYDGKRGHPVMLSRKVIAELLQLSPDSSPQDVIRKHYPETCFLDVHDEGVVRDVDLSKDYDNLLRSPSGMASS